MVPLSTAGFADGLGQQITGRRGQLTLFLPSTISVAPVALTLSVSDLLLVKRHAWTISARCIGASRYLRQIWNLWEPLASSAGRQLVTTSMLRLDLHSSLTSSLSPRSTSSTRLGSTPLPGEMIQLVPPGKPTCFATQLPLPYYERISAWTGHLPTQSTGKARNMASSSPLLSPVV